MTLDIAGTNTDSAGVEGQQYKVSECGWRKKELDSVPSLYNDDSRLGVDGRRMYNRVYTVAADCSGMVEVDTSAEYHDERIDDFCTCLMVFHWLRQGSIIASRDLEPHHVMQPGQLSTTYTSLPPGLFSPFSLSFLHTYLGPK